MNMYIQKLFPRPICFGALKKFNGPNIPTLQSIIHTVWNDTLLNKSIDIRDN